MTTAKQFQKIKENAELYEKEKKRINAHNMWRYYNEEGYKEKLLEKQRLYRLAKREKKKANQALTDT